MMGGDVSVLDRVLEQGSEGERLTAIQAEGRANTPREASSVLPFRFSSLLSLLLICKTILSLFCGVFFFIDI